MGSRSAAALAAGVLAVAVSVPSLARDNGRYAKMDPAMHAWFDRLASGKGLCCSFADGFSIADVDWDTKDGRFGCASTVNGSTCPIPPS